MADRGLHGHPVCFRDVVCNVLEALVEEISLKAVRQRLAGLLLELADEADSVHLPWNNQEIAARIGTVREIVSRTFSRMAHEGVLRIDGREITILDRERL